MHILSSLSLRGSRRPFHTASYTSKGDKLRFFRATNAQLMTFGSIDNVAREWIRTTSLLERTNRELLRKFRQALTFGSPTGANVAVFLQVQRLHARLYRCGLVASLS